MISRTISKTPLASDPDQAREQLEELAGTLAAEDAAAGQQLRAVAVELVRRGLHVALVGYRDGWTEIEATLPQAPHLGPVTVDRDAAGTTCQLAWDCWADITTADGATAVGEVTSGSFSPSLNKNIGMGWVRGDLAAPGTALAVLVRDQPVGIQAVKRPMYKRAK